VLRGPTPNKGARLTTTSAWLALPGLYAHPEPTGVSRRINDEPERQRIKATLEELRPTAGGLIARTACRARVWKS